MRLIPLASDPECVPVMIQKNFESGISCILADLFDIYLKESCFPFSFLECVTRASCL